MSKATVRTPTIEFSRGVADDDDGRVVRRRGVIFRSGDYPTQAFSMTPAEITALAEGFRGPIPLDHGHPSTDGPIDFGRLVGVSASPDGTTLYGEIEAPSWLDLAMAGAKAWRVSASFDRATKAIRRLSLVTRPQISDAELQAAFACACGGDHHPKAEDPPMEPWKEKALADLEALPEDERSGVLAILGGAAPVASDDDDDDDDDDGGGDLPEQGTSDFAEDDFRDARIAELEAKDRRRDAEVFVDGAIKDGLALPAERARLVARHAQFSLLEQATPAEFSDGRPLRLVADFEADIRARPPHRWGKNLIPADFAGRALDNGGDRPETDEEYARRVNAKHNGRFRKSGAGS
jgi:hypothetical protein